MMELNQETILVSESAAVIMPTALNGRRNMRARKGLEVMEVVGSRLKNSSKGAAIAKAILSAGMKDKIIHITNSIQNLCNIFRFLRSPAETYRI
jgi:hypothetical protein